MNESTVEVDTGVRPQKLGTTCSAEGVEAHYTLLPPGNSFYLARWGKVATAGTSESMADVNDMSGSQRLRLHSLKMSSLLHQAIRTTQVTLEALSIT